MSKRRKLNHLVSTKVIVLDSLGALLVGGGLAEWWIGTGFMPEQYRFENYPLIMMAAGGLVMLPAIYSTFKAISSTTTTR